MPQFDQFSFFNQVSWSLFFFFNFYFFVTYFFLPKICYNLKFRKKKIIFDNKKKNQINFEKNNIILFFNSSYKIFCSNFELFFNKKLSIYNINQKKEVRKAPIFTNLLKNKINIFLIQKFLLFKTFFVEIN